jgi:alkanesulfonate monooxygenase SsuD/methylene tetrahydromethanopterin reductase-like flavin-dependent oxidoreductase (luciferase family)
MTTLGAVFRPQVAPERLRDVARVADETGLEQLWLWEDCFFESGIASAAAALAWTSRVRVGVGLLPVPLRNVALTAMEAATLHRLFPGRVRIGVGHGVQDWMGQVGARVDSPVTLLREHLSALLASGHAVGLLWALLALLALLLVQIRNWYGLWSVLVTGGVVAGVTAWLPPHGQAAFAA